MDEPRHFVSELWGWAIRGNANPGGNEAAVTATVFHRLYQPPAIRGSFEARSGLPSEVCLRRARELCDRLNREEPW